MKNFNTKLAFHSKKIYADTHSIANGRHKNGALMHSSLVATMLYNIQLYNRGLHNQVKDELSAAIPNLVDMGLFDLFSPEEWINSENPGRRFVGEAAKEYMEDQALSFALAFI